MSEQDLEKTLASGEVCTLTIENTVVTQYVVDMWTADGDNRRNRFYKTYEEAKREYDKW